MSDQSMSTDDIRLKIQALADNELPESEIGPVLERIQGSYEYREEYAQLLRLRKRLAGVVVPEPRGDWVVEVEKKTTRKLTRGLGSILFIASYVALLGVGIVSVVRESEVPVYVAVLVGVGALGFVTLLINAIADRVRESRTDKYKGVMR
jgi:hypothetical protein